MKSVNQQGEIYQAFLKGKSYDQKSKDCILDTVQKMHVNFSNDDHPGMLLGKIQSGKTRTYLGCIALAFDNDYDITIVFTKGSNPITHQTVARLEDEFSELINYDKVDVFDIMAVRNGLNLFQIQKKLIIVCKKEDDNLRHLHNLLFKQNEELGKRRTLIIDDEADFASISFSKKNNEIKAGAIANLINQLRKKLPLNSSFLQVTATPYSLYLQPKTEAKIQSEVFKPTRPAFTVLVPIHDKYIGGDYYFRDSEVPDTVAWFLHEKIDPQEMDRLRRPDRRSCKPEEILTDHKLKGLRCAIINFLVAACIRRIQQKIVGEFPEKYSFVVHTDISKATHQWQQCLLETLVEKFKEVLSSNPSELDPLITEAYENLKRSLQVYQKENPKSALPTPPLSKTIAEVRSTFQFLTVTVVNSDNDVKNLLDTRTGQLKLTSPYTIFVGGMILDRGLTIENMIGFFYGRNPKRFQQDTVLQHSRMYGARPKSDLPLTRFYTTEHIYEIMKNIHEFDNNLREEIEKFGEDAGVVFIQRDAQDQIRPCSPNKILISETTNLRPYKRLLPIGFQTGYQSKIGVQIQAIETLLPNGEPSDPSLLDINKAEKIIDLIATTLKFNKKDYKGGQVPGPDYFQELGYSWDVEAFKAAMRYISISCENSAERNKILCLVRRNRNNYRIRQDTGRFTNAPDTAHVEGRIAKQWAQNIPMLMLFHQNGDKDKGWLGAHFWWPVLYMPKKCKVAVYANETAKA